MAVKNVFKSFQKLLVNKAMLFKKLYIRVHTLQFLKLIVEYACHRKKDMNNVPVLKVCFLTTHLGYNVCY